MNRFLELIIHSMPAGVSTGHSIIILSLVAFLGMGVGAISIFGVRFGVAGVLFVGLAFGHFGLTIDHTVLEFARDFGLILFVYTIGIQIGPGFVASLRRQGLPLNLMAAGIVLLGVLLTIGFAKLALPKADFPAMVGVFCGATTNTPSLAAAQQAVGTGSPDIAKLPALGYAVAYPLGIMGIIFSMFFIRWVFRVDLKKETQGLLNAEGAGDRKMEAVNVEVTNDALAGNTLEHLLSRTNGSVVVSRVMHHENTLVATGAEVLEHGDVLRAVGPAREIKDFTGLVGHERAEDHFAAPGLVSFRDLLVTQNKAIGKSVPDLNLGARFQVAATRISRGDVDMPVTQGVKIMFGDRIRVVGEDDALKQVAQALGNSIETRDHPMVIPLFLGIVLGVILGSLPIPLPGFPVPVKLGLAGGPLVAAIILGRIGKIGPLVWYMPRSANLLVREIGIVLFLACVGIKAGDKFVETLVHGNGLMWMGYGAVITIVPLVLVAVIARLAFKLNYMPICGLLAGSMTDPPALAFAGMITRSEAPSVAYASVYPLVMILRILAAQAMILFFR